MKILLSIFPVFGLFSCSSCSNQSATINTPAPQILNVDAPITQAEAIYDYVYPLVIVKISPDVMFTVPFRPRTTPNHVIHLSNLAQQEQRAVVFGNLNTLYSVG